MTHRINVINFSVDPILGPKPLIGESVKIEVTGPWTKVSFCAQALALEDVKRLAESNAQRFVVNINEQSFRNMRLQAIKADKAISLNGRILVEKTEMEFSNEETAEEIILALQAPALA